MKNITAARALGWASLGIAAAELLAPKFIERQLGIRDHEGLLRALGVRELASGVGALTEDHPDVSLWSRVAGDAIDLALLGAAARESDRKAGLITAIVLVAGIAALDYIYARRLQKSPPHHGNGRH